MKKMAKLLAFALCATLFLMPTISWAATPEEKSSSPSNSISLVYEVDEPPQSVEVPLEVQTTPKTNDKPLAIGCVLITVGSGTFATIAWKKAYSNEK